MQRVRAFDNIDEIDLKKMLLCFESFKMHYNKDTTILSNVATSDTIGVIVQGKAQIIRYNYDGSRTFIESLEEGDMFGSITSIIDEGIYINSITECEIILFNYSKLITTCKKNCEYHTKLINNTMHIINYKLKKYNERVEILTKKTIRDKLLTYFGILQKNQFTKNLMIPYSLTDLADYLAIDRSAMMREIKYLKEEGLIDSKGRKIEIKY